MRILKRNDYFFLTFFTDFGTALQHFISENQKIYKIGRIPKVFKTAITINQATEPFRADFHKAKSFQTADHNKRIDKSQTFIPNDVAIKDK